MDWLHCWYLFRSGGEAHGCGELADALYAARGTKPIYAVCNDQTCSAAYWLASAADRIYTTQTGMLGSVSCFMLHCNQAEADKAKGLEYTYIQADEYKTDGNPHEPLSDHALDKMQAEVTRVRDLFVSSVARNRSVSVDALLALKGDVRFAEGAIPLLADRLGTRAEALEDMRAQIGAAAADNTLMVSAMEAQTIEAFQRGDLEVGIQFIETTREGQEYRTFQGQPIYSPRASEMVSALPRIRETYPEAIAAIRQVRSESGAAAMQDSRKVTLLLAPYDGSSANLGSFKEVYRPGCFRNGLTGDLRVMFCHADSSQHVIGRTSAGTARFWEDAAGLHAEAIAPETSWADDLLVSMRRKDITQSSAAFWITRQSWETRGGERYRIVEEAIAHDGSVETFPAYENSTATAAQAATLVPKVESDHLGLARKHLELLRLR